MSGIRGRGSPSLVVGKSDLAELSFARLPDTIGTGGMTSCKSSGNPQV